MSTTESAKDTWFDQTFRDSEGNLVIAQKPNLPILVGLSASVLGRLITTGNLHRCSDALAFGALFTWAWLEIFQGVNYFRRSLGFIVLLGIFATKLQWS